MLKTGLGLSGNAVATPKGVSLTKFESRLYITYFLSSGILSFSLHWLRSLGRFPIREELQLPGIATEQFSFLSNSLTPPILFDKDHSLQSSRIAYLMNVIYCGSSMSIVNSRSLWIPNLSLRLGKDFFSSGRPSYEREETRGGPFPISSLIDKP